MKKQLIFFGAGLMITGGLWLAMQPSMRLTQRLKATLAAEEKVEEEEKSREEKDKQALYVRERWLYEFNMLKDPTTGRIPANIRKQELMAAARYPDKQISGLARTTGNYTYTPAGPTNIGGRTRAVEFDKRYNGTTNRVIIAGSVSGGIMRSTDGGATWIRVTPEGTFHNLVSLAQDPRPGQQDTWYAGGGENLGSSTSEDGASYNGFGIFKSTDNGATWSQLPLAITDENGTALGAGTLEAFDNPFDFAHRIAIDPTNGNVYVAAHRRLIRSVNGGNNWNVVFTTSNLATSVTGQTDVVITNTGRVFVAASGAVPSFTTDLAGFWTSGENRKGVWTSANGNQGTFTQIFGTATSGYRATGRTILALNPNSNNQLYVMYQNGLNQAGATGVPEADLFRLDFASNNFNAWTNLSANMPDIEGSTLNLDGSDPLALQGGYNMALHVKPDDPSDPSDNNTVYVGGTNLYASLDGFTTSNNTRWIGGYSNVKNAQGRWSYGSYDFVSSDDQGSHADIHWLSFDPSNPNRVICGNDGGIQVANNIRVDPVDWTPINNYQTLQYYHVAMDHTAGSNIFMGGAQDNGTHLYDGEDATPTVQTRVGGGDGVAVAVTSFQASTAYLFFGSQYGSLTRGTLTSANYTTANIKPADANLTANPSAGHGDFVTFFKINPDNTEQLYYVNYNRLFRTVSASSVTRDSWTEMTGVSGAVNTTNNTSVSIRSIAFTRGTYHSGHSLYFGTDNARIFRLDNPRDAIASTTPIDITPSSGFAGTVVDIAVNPNDDNEILAVVSNYNVTSIWHTKNAKSISPTWRNAEGNLTLPSIRSCEIVVSRSGSTPITEYFVGTSVGLYSVENLSQKLDNSQPITWLREGGNVLNLAVVTTMDYRPQDNTLLVGTHGNGMYFAKVGTPNFIPTLPTSTNNPVRNDPSFVKQVFPTIVQNDVNYTVGNLLGVQTIMVRITAMTGQVVYQQQKPYQSGKLNVSNLAKGAYILTITSADGKHQKVQKFVKE